MTVFVKQVVVSLDSPSSPLANAARAGSFTGEDLLKAFAPHDAELEQDDVEDLDGMLAAEASARNHPTKSQDQGLLDEGVQRALARFEDYLLTSLSVPYLPPASASLPSKKTAAVQASANLVRAGQPLTFGSDLCYVPTFDAPSPTCFHLSSLDSRTLVISLVFPQSATYLPSTSALLPVSAAASSALPQTSFYHASFAAKLRNLPTFSVDGTSVSPQPADSIVGTGATAWGAEAVIAGKRIGEMKSMRWMLYAIVALVLRFGNLAKVCI